MKRIVLFFVIGAVIPLHAVSLGWKVNSGLAMEPESGDLVFAESGVQLKVDQAFGAKASFSGRLKFTWRAPLSDTAASESGTGELVPEIRDAYIDIFNFPVSGMELRIGKQRLNFGKSDFFRHLDVVNPFDSSDPILFDRRVPSWLVRLKWSFGFDTALEVFAGPGTEQGMYMQGMNGMDEQLPLYSGLLGGGYTLNSRLDIPDAGVETGVAGARFRTKIGKWDTALVWITRLSPFPMAETVAGTSSDSSGTVIFSEKREQYLGLALAGELLGLGVRGELLFRYHPGLTTSILVDGSPAGSSVSVERGWDILWSAGIDYQFPNGGPYLNLEFSRGFIGEYSRSGSGINHYLALSFEQKWDSDRFRMSVSIGFEFDKLGEDVSRDEFRKTTAWFAGPELRMSVGNNLEFALGLFYVNAPSTTTLGQSGFRTLTYLRGEAKF